jgi:hypothetical protein
MQLFSRPVCSHTELDCAVLAQSFQAHKRRLRDVYYRTTKTVIQSVISIFKVFINSSIGATLNHFVQVSTGLQALHITHVSKLFSETRNLNMKKIRRDLRFFTAIKMSILISGESDNFPVKRNNFEEI